VTKKALRPAAVLAPLIPRPDGLRLIFTVRSPALTQHAGQISFPGGRVDPGDASLGAAAVREAEEEIGMKPEQVELLGAFDSYETATGFEVTPFVGLVDPDFAPVPDPREVEEVFEAPFAFFMDPANHARAWREWKGEKRYFYEMPYEDRYVWGATAGMLKALADRFAGGEA
jgi:8-oxo-dGTP pyrophosphatase MutT (NUDIX family)